MRCPALLLALFAFGLVLVGCSQPDDPDPQPDPESVVAAPLTVENAWARPAAAGGNSALYVTLVGGTSADTLLSAASGAADTVEIHESFETDDGMMGMRPVPMLPVPAGASVALEPGSYHVMLIGASRDYVVGERVDAVLTFAQTGPVSIMAEVAMTVPEAMMAEDADHEAMGHGDADQDDTDATE